ncbi:MAG: hypothetical protein QM758_05280 [Armatimonas sp.]
MTYKLAPRSLRTRLTLWNMVILALILLALALVLRLIVARSLQDSIDSDLRARAKGAQQYAARLAQKAKEAGQEFAPKKEKPTPSVADRQQTSAPSQWQTRFVEWWFEPDGKRLLGPPEETPLDPVALQSAARGEECLTTVSLSGEAVRVCSTPLLPVENSSQFYVIQAGYSLTDIMRAQANLDRALACC